MIQLMVGQRQLQAIIRRIVAAKEQQARLLPSLARDIARGLVKVTKHRIKVTKIAPDGVPWRKWSTSYAATRSSRHSLNVDTRKLLNSIEPYSAPSGKILKVRSRLSYAGFVQRQRAFLGMGALENQLIDNIAERYMRKVMR